VKILEIEFIKELCRNKKIRWTNHIFVRLVQRGISMNDVTTAIINGEIIENYPDDYPYPSCLILGLTVNNKPLHVVCGTNGIELWLITAYYPNADMWSSDFKTRKE
jgi:hypothetical protein